jgi:hypothetical protein
MQKFFRCNLSSELAPIIKRKLLKVQDTPYCNHLYYDDIIHCINSPYII